MIETTDIIMTDAAVETDSATATDKSAGNDAENVTCINCGTVASGHFCPNCGQSLHTPRRITMKTFWKGMAMSFARMTPGFWDTFIGLIIHPWEVIRQYIHGKRIRYSPPVTMVIQLMLYFTFFYTVLGHIFGVDIIRPEEPRADPQRGWLMQMILSSDVFGKILIASILAFNCRLTYGYFTHRRYNLAEYFTAAVYMACCFSIYSNLVRPLELYDIELGGHAKMLAAVIVGTLALNKAFPIRRWWNKILVWLSFVMLNILTIVLIASIVGFLETVGC